MRIPKMMRAAILESFASPTLQCFLNYWRSSPRNSRPSLRHRNA